MSSRESMVIFLAALFDQYNVDANGHFLGESSSYSLSTNPALPQPINSVAPAASPSQRVRSSIADGSVHDALGSSAADPTSTVSNLSFSSQLGHSAATPSTSASPLPQTPSSPGPRIGLGISAADAAPGLSSGASTSTSFSMYSNSEFPAVAQSPAVLSQFPPPHLARELIALFLSKVNRFAPIVSSMFLEEYDTGVPQSPLLLLAIFSIASKYSTDLMCRSDPRRAQTAGENYCKTACHLVDEFLDRPRLSTIQGLFLLGKHLEETKSQAFLTKSSMYIGMAVRMALDMGLNRDCSGWGLSPTQVEYRNRTWWYLYVFDRTQGSINGRPFLIQDHDCAAEKPKPDPLAHSPAYDQMDIEYMLHLIHIASLLGRVVNNFYITNTSGRGYFSSSWNTHGRLAEGSSEPLTSAAGSRKRSKTTSHMKSRSQDQESSMDEFDDSGSAPNRDPGQDAGTSTNRIRGKLQARQDTLTRQHLSNQKQDALVAELDKELTEWIQSLPPRLQWDNLQNHPDIYGDTLHSIYNSALILLHRPSIRVGELMPLNPVSRLDGSSTVPDANVTIDGSHSLAVCAQAARRITRLAERCDNLTHLERFGIGAYSLLHAARIHLILAAIPTTPRTTGEEAGERGAIQRKEQAVDQFHRTLGSLRKFSVYHWTMDGIGLSIRTFERTLAAILHEQEQEQEIDQEQELRRQEERLAQRDAEFFGRDNNGSIVVAVNKVGATDNEAHTNKSAASENKSENESFYERAYYESMRFLEMRLLYQARHSHFKDSHLEEYLQHLDFQQQLNPGMDFAFRGGLLDFGVPTLTHRSIMHTIADLFDKNVPLTPQPDGASITHSAVNTSSIPTPDIPGLVIRTYKPNVSGKSKRNRAFNAATSRVGSTTIRNKTTSGPPRTTENNSISTGRPAGGASANASNGSAMNPGQAVPFNLLGFTNAAGVPTVPTTYTRNYHDEVLESSDESPLSMTGFRPVARPSPTSQPPQPPQPSQSNGSGAPLVSIAARAASIGQFPGGVSSSIATAMLSGIGLNRHRATRGQSTQHSPSQRHVQPMYRSEQLFLQQQRQRQMQQQLGSQQLNYQQQLMQQQRQSQSSPSLQNPGQMQAQQRQSPSPPITQAGQTAAQPQSSQQENMSTQIRKSAYIITTATAGETNPDILMVYANDMDPNVCETSLLVHTQQLPTENAVRHLQEAPLQNLRKHLQQESQHMSRMHSSRPPQFQHQQQPQHNLLLPLQQQTSVFSQPMQQQQGYPKQFQKGQNQSNVFVQQVNQSAAEAQVYSQYQHQVLIPGEDGGQGNLPGGFGGGQPVSHNHMLQHQQTQQLQQSQQQQLQQSQQQQLQQSQQQQQQQSQQQQQQQSQQQHHHQISGYHPSHTSRGSPAGSSASIPSPSPASSNSTTRSPMTHLSAIVHGHLVTPSAGPVIHLAPAIGAMALFDTEFPPNTPNNADPGVDGSQQTSNCDDIGDMYWDQFG